MQKRFAQRKWLFDFTPCFIGVFRFAQKSAHLIAQFDFKNPYFIGVFLWHTPCIIVLVNKQEICQKAGGEKMTKKERKGLAEKHLSSDNGRVFVSVVKAILEDGVQMKNAEELKAVKADIIKYRAEGVASYKQIRYARFLIGRAGNNPKYTAELDKVLENPAEAFEAVKVKLPPAKIWTNATPKAAQSVTMTETREMQIIIDGIGADVCASAQKDAQKETEDAIF